MLDNKLFVDCMAIPYRLRLALHGNVVGGWSFRIRGIHFSHHFERLNPEEDAEDLFIIWTPNWLWFNTVFLEHHWGDMTADAVVRYIK